jgi:trehalose 6-phosphate phosphatase
MMYLLSGPGRERLSELAAASVLVAFDYDGTLAPITDDPARAAMRTETRALFCDVCAHFPCAIITGRARSDVETHLVGVNVQAIAGNHGAELPGFDAPPSEDVRRWSAELTRTLAGAEGVLVEEKRLSLAVHYRAAKDKAGARRAVFAAAEALSAVRLIGGKDIVNVLPIGARHKGFALDELRTAAGCERALYVGDDETDEDVFRMRAEKPFFTVCVGPRRSSFAEYYLKTQREVDALLRALLAARRAPVTDP